MPDALSQLWGTLVKPYDLVTTIQPMSVGGVIPRPNGRWRCSIITKWYEGQMILAAYCRHHDHSHTKPWPSVVWWGVVWPHPNAYQMVGCGRLRQHPTSAPSATPPCITLPFDHTHIKICTHHLLTHSYIVVCLKIPYTISRCSSHAILKTHNSDDDIFRSVQYSC